MTPSSRCRRWTSRSAAEAARDLLDLLLPGSCAGCGAPARDVLCAPCLGACRLPAGPACEACGAPWTRARHEGCGRCRRFGRPFTFVGAAGMWRYRGPVRALVHAFKYRGRRDLLAPLGRRLAQDARARAAASGRPAPLVVAVPARPSARRTRGYDQAEELARAFAGALGLDCAPGALRRRRDDAPQAGRTRRRRRVQAAGAFRARPELAWGERVLLVDDVLSTGATADACARALVRAGATEVAVLALAT